MTNTAIDTAERTQSARYGTSPSDYIASVLSEGRRFADVAEQVGLETPIPTCPGWAMRDLIRHLGEIHLWAAANVAAPKPHWLQVNHISELERYWPDLAAQWPPDNELTAWYRATLTNLVVVLRSAPLDVEAFTFLPAPTPLTMWARRQASEIAVHRFDAELALGVASDFDPSFASDMLDELVSGFAPLYRPAKIPADRVLQIVAADVDERWWVTIGPSGVTSSRTGGRADLTITATAAELYLLLWNRTADSTVDLDGAPDVMDLWRTTCRVEWSGA